MLDSITDLVTTAQELKIAMTGSLVTDEPKIIAPMDPRQDFEDPFKKFTSFYTAAHITPPTLIFE